MGNRIMMAAILFQASYIAGSINFPVILFSLLGKGDPRNRFSGNAGVTNVYRQAGFFWSGVILLLDLGRAYFIAWAALYLLQQSFVTWIGLALILGNRFPCFHRFRGGKGVASYLGFTALISPLSAVAAALVWLMAYGLVRIPFIASFFMIVVLMAGSIIACGYQPSATGGTLATALFIFYNHRQNITELFGKRA